MQANGKRCALTDSCKKLMQILTTKIVGVGTSNLNRYSFEHTKVRIYELKFDSTTFK